MSVSVDRTGLISAAAHAAREEITVPRPLIDRHGFTAAETAELSIAISRAERPFDRPLGQIALGTLKPGVRTHRTDTDPFVTTAETDARTAPVWLTFFAGGG